MLPPLWVCAVAALPMLGLGGARVRSAVAALVFTSAIAGTGWLVWLLSELSPRAVVFIVLWTLFVLYFIVAAGAFKTQMGRFMPWRQSFGAALRETALHLVEALLWGPLTVRVLLSRRRP